VHGGGSNVDYSHGASLLAQAARRHKINGPHPAVPIEEMRMKKALYSLSALVLAGCAATSDTPQMSAAELNECLQPNRRVVVEVVGQVVKPPAKKPAAKPQETAAGKPEAAKPEAAKPEAKPAKPEMANFEQSTYVQGNEAFDPGSAALKAGGQKELDGLMALLKKRAVRIGAIIIAGHTDKLEADSGNKGLSEGRAQAVKDYLVSKGLDQKLMFWEGKEAREPVPVTKFCS
jgi:outer membrane protein OmpA-like peptidoglycan-associated protein